MHYNKFDVSAIGIAVVWILKDALACSYLNCQEVMQNNMVLVFCVLWL